MVLNMKQAGRILVVFAWVAFLICLFLPAVQFQDGRGIVGWQIGLMAISELPRSNSSTDAYLIFGAGIGNIIIALSPFALILRLKYLNAILAVLGTVLFCIAASFYDATGGFGSGYYLWVAAFLVMGLGFSLRALAENN